MQALSEAERADRGSQRRLVWWAVGLCSLVVVGYLVSVPLGLIDPADRLGTGEITLAAIVIVALAFAAQRTYSITSLTFGGAKAEFERIDLRQAKIEADVRALQVAVSGIVNKFELVHLERLSGDRPVIVRYGNIMQEELRHLDAIDYVQPTTARGLNAIPEEHGSGTDDFDLKDYVAITKEGLNYLAVRSQLKARALKESTES